MTRRYLSGGWYGELLPTGEYAVCVPHVGLQTHLGLVKAPPGETFGILFPRCTTVGGFRVAGQAHDHIEPAWEYLGTGWRARTDLPLPAGLWPCIYDHGGVLHVNDGTHGAQGYRTVTPDNRLVTGEATYGPFQGLSEYTDLGDGLLIGQGHAGGGALVFDGTVLRVLEPGYRRFVVANRAGDRVTICMGSADGAILIQTTMAELRALPIARAPSPAPAPVPVPVPAPVPEPVPMPRPFDPSIVTFVDNPPDLARWPQTATITSVTFPNGRICVDHDRRSGPLAWPDAPFGDGSAGTCQYTLGLCAAINGQWYGSAVIQFWRGRDLAAGGDLSAIATDWYYSGRWAPLTGHQPAPGELVAWFVAAGNLRDNTRVGVKERSNFLVLPFGQEYHADAPAPTPPPTPAPPSPSPTDPYAALQAAIDRLTARIAQLEQRPAPLPTKIALRTDNGHYLCAEGGGGDGVTATRTTAGAWESFAIEDQS